MRPDVIERFYTYATPDQRARIDKAVDEAAKQWMPFNLPVSQVKAALLAACEVAILTEIWPIRKGMAA